jgi:hypothetical protein
MTCDDHDVTDDWFMNWLWCRRVIDLPAARATSTHL